MTDRVIYRKELMEKLGVTSETIRQWLKKGRLPKPDIALSRRTVGWRLSTLNAAGVGVV
jgi:predicted DNA-binding transcriptional regulator AlpA